MTRTILFDFDGVLADTLDDMLNFSQAVCSILGHDCQPSPRDLDILDSMDILSYGRQLGLPANKLEDFGGMMVEQFRLKQDPPALFAGLVDVIRQSSRNSRIGVVTGNSTEIVREFIVHHGLDNYFNCVLGADTPGSRGDKIRRAVQEMEGCITSTFMVGDSISDVRAAKEVGAISVAVTWGHQSEARLAAAEPRMLAHSPAELLRILNGSKDLTR